jgi:UDP-2,3-diacylglucosamine pyrophosphatase LpxH
MNHYRTIWISDIHLGTRVCKAEVLLNFLREHDADTIYLVGDIIDGWELKKSWYWEQTHNDVIQKLLRKVRKGTQVIFIPGNHDEFARDYADLEFGGITVKLQDIHTTANGKRLLVTHGDEFDSVVKHARWLAKLGSHAYDVACILNHWFNIVRRKLGFPYWSLSAYLKLRVKNAVQFISDYEKTLVHKARRTHVDGVVCGHIHKADIQEIDGIWYYNDGDWVESCTALVEHDDGRMEIIDCAVKF